MGERNICFLLSRNASWVAGKTGTAEASILVNPAYKNEAVKTQHIHFITLRYDNPEINCVCE